MSARALAWAWAQMPRLTPSQKIVLVAIADRSDDDGVSFYKHATLADKVGINRDGVRDHLRALEGLGLLVREPQAHPDGRQASNITRLLMGVGDIAHPPTERPPEEGDERPPRGGAGAPTHKTSTTDTSIEDVPGAMREVWAYYQRVIDGGERFKLNDTRRRIIRNALKVRSLAEVKAAIDGLAASPHHNGQNDQKRKYLDIRYALAGKGNESNDERIDKAATWAHSTQPSVEVRAPDYIFRGLFRAKDIEGDLPPGLRGSYDQAIEWLDRRGLTHRWEGNRVVYERKEDA